MKTAQTIKQNNRSPQQQVWCEKSTTRAPQLNQGETKQSYVPSPLCFNNQTPHLCVLYISSHFWNSSHSQNSSHVTFSFVNKQLTLDHYLSQPNTLFPKCKIRPVLTLLASNLKLLILYCVHPMAKYFLLPLLLLCLIYTYERQQKYFHYFLCYTSMGFHIPCEISLLVSYLMLLTHSPFFKK